MTIDMLLTFFFLFFFFNDTATTEIYTLSLHDALPICQPLALSAGTRRAMARQAGLLTQTRQADRKSTRLNSRHGSISYAVFCLQKKSLAWLAVGLHKERKRIHLPGPGLVGF